MKSSETPRLILRKWKRTDAIVLFTIIKSPSVLMGSWKPHSDINISAEALYKYIKSKSEEVLNLLRILLFIKVPYSCSSSQSL